MQFGGTLHFLMWKCAILLAILMGCAFAEQPSSGPLAQGIELLQKGDFQHSLILLRHAVELQPGSAPAHNYYGFALARNGSLDQADPGISEGAET